MSDPRPGELFAGYRIEREVGRGGMGAVFLAQDVRLGRPVALKIVIDSLSSDPEFQNRFQREAGVATSLEHPNVVPVYDVGESDGTLFIAFRYVDGQDLASVLRDHGALAPPRAARIVSQVCSALDAAHRKGLVHRDVKPANVLLSGAAPEEHAYLTDFGLTREAASQTGLTGTGQWLGTVDYAAPEQIEAQPVDARTDVYAVGCMAYHLLTGVVPFEGGMATKVYGHVHLPPPCASKVRPDLAPEVDAVIMRAMAKAPADRYVSAGDFGRAFAAAIAGAAIPVAERSVATGRAQPEDAPAAAPDPTVALTDPLVAGRRTPRPAPEPPPTTVSPRRAEAPRRRPWLIAGVVVLVGAGIAVALLAGGSSPSHHASVSTSATATTTVTAPSGAPSLTGSRDCGGGLTAGPHTSCGFAENVRKAYDQTGSGVLTVASPVTGQTYRMYCTSGSTHVCTGANHASVTFGGSGHPASQSCGGGLSVGPNTSCGFAKNVRRAYEASHSGVVRASSPATGSTYTMYCTDRSPHTCTGGNDAAVYFP